jgi:hypothetical protein
VYQPRARVAGHALDDGHGLLQVGALDVLGHVLVVDPLEAMAGDLVAQLGERCADLGVALQRGGHAEHRERQAALLKFAQDAPDARARAVFVDALHAHVPLGVAGRVEHLGEELLRARVAVQHTVFAAFLVVQHELHGNARAAGPAGVRRVAAVADEVARVGQGGVVGPCCRHRREMGES